MQNYMNVVNRPRTWNRAKAHLITKEELCVEFGDEYEAVLEDGLDVYKDGLKKILMDRKEDLRRGDFIYLGPEVGYRNDGILMYDGENVIPLGCEVWDYGCIPEEFQIGEFPPFYWNGLMDDPGYVPFNFAKHLSYYTVENIKYITRKDNGKAHLLIPFTLNGQTYAIVKYEQVDEDKANDKEVLQQFLNDVKKETYFSYYNTNIFSNDPLSLSDLMSEGLSDDWSYEQLLFHVIF